MKQMFLTVSEAAKIIGVTPDGVRAMERRGSLPAIKTPSGRRLFTESDVQEFARSRLDKNGEVADSATGKRRVAQPRVG